MTAHLIVSPQTVIDVQKRCDEPKKSAKYQENNNQTGSDQRSIYLTAFSDSC